MIYSKNSLLLIIDIQEKFRPVISVGIRTSFSCAIFLKVEAIKPLRISSASIRLLSKNL